MRTGPGGVALIQAFESCLRPAGSGQFRTYVCPAGVLTIGWGTTRHDVPELKPGDVWSRQRCDEVFAASLPKYEAPVRELAARRVRAGHAALTQHQFDALVSGVYNAGPGLLAGNVGRAVAEGRDREVPDYLARWNKGGGRVLAGLVRRRKAEGELWRGDAKAAERTAGTIIPGTMPQARETPSPTAAELARRTPAATAGVAAGAGTAAGGGTFGDGSGATLAVVALGVALALVAAAVAARRWAALRKDWA